MKPKSVTVEALPESWFARPQYKPRVPADGKAAWLPLREAFRPVIQVPAAPPPEPRVPRRDLRAAFEETYREWALPRRKESEQALAELEERGTAVVVAGQQPGFLGGPLFTLYKALSAIGVARRYRASTGRPCVPVFWVASEDHDLDEVREVRMPAPGDGEAVFSYSHAADRRPLSDYPIDAATLQVLDAARGHLAHRMHGERAAALIELYRGRNLASGFAALYAELLGHTGLLFLDPAALRPLAAPLFREVIEDPNAILALIEEGRREVRKRGLAPLVAARFPLFIVRAGGRHSLLPALAADPSAAGAGQCGFRAGDGTMFEKHDLLRLLEEDPRAFSSGALLRPLVEHYTLPCLLTIGGPAEVGYFAQLPPLARHLGLAPPAIGLRLDATLVEGKAAQAARGVPLARLAAARSPEEILAGGDESPALEELRRLAARIEEALSRALDELPAGADATRLKKRARAVSDDIARLAADAAAARAGAGGDELRRLRKLWNFVFPGGMLQERRWNVLHFVARHGTSWLDEVLAALEEDPLRIVHRWITFDEVKPP